MVGVPFLVTRCDCGPSLRIGWPLPRLSRNWSLIAGPNRKTNTQAGATPPAGAERDVAQDVERPDRVRESGKPVQHGSAVDGRNLGGRRVPRLAGIAALQGLGDGRPPPAAGLLDA